jgi:hypothetical protein
MLYSISLQTEAIEDMKIAFEWYEEQKAGLGYSFIDAVNECFEKITENPLNLAFQISG